MVINEPDGGIIPPEEESEGVLLATINYSETAQASNGITDLTGYTCELNENADIYGPTGYGGDSEIYSINFVSKNNNYNSFELVGGGKNYAYLSYSNQQSNNAATYYRGTITWSDQDYRTIQITGGTDATNPDLIAWLEDNGTLTAPQPSVDLTGTKWVLKDNAEPNLTNNTYSVNFVSNNTNYIEIGFSYYSEGHGSSEETYSFLKYNTTLVLTEYVQAYTFTWENEAYKTITFTGGIDATNANLIAWLSQNATQVVEPTISDLTGYTWVANNSPTAPLTEPEVYNLSFTSDEFDFTRIVLDIGRNNIAVIEYGNYIVLDDGGNWLNDAYKTIQITGGTDATNANLIAWLEANGTLTAPIQANTYNLTHTLTNLTHGNITLTITPDNGYTYPTSLTISNGTLVSYDNTTGVAVISGDDTTTVSGECGVAVSGFEVELYGAGGDGEMIYVQINDDPTWYYANMYGGNGFSISDTNIPNAYTKYIDESIGIPNVSKIKIGTQGNPSDNSGPRYYSSNSTGNFVGLTFTSTGGSAPAYATSEITMTQDSKIHFEGDD